MNENAEALRALMAEHGLSQIETAALVRVSQHTVKAWLRPCGGKAHNPTPLWAVELLGYKVGALGVDQPRQRKAA